ncbi:hypothetical protein KEM54_001064 [Ascosphaera aggregata]|nr:hypothetical protein KEM54_001064 [Ascosphaera aggregata]
MSSYQPTYVPFSGEFSVPSPLEGPKPALTPGTNFKVDVNRNKSHRWVTARSCTYDGDDWGNSSDDDDDEEEEEQGRKTEEVRSKKEEQRCPPVPPLSKNVPGMHGLGFQSHDTVLLPHQSGAGLKRRSLALSPTRQPSLSGLKASPSSTRAEPPKASPSRRQPSGGARSALFVRPADIYKRMEEEKQQQRTQLPPQLQPGMRQAAVVQQQQQQPARPQTSTNVSPVLNASPSRSSIESAHKNTRVAEPSGSPQQALEGVQPLHYQSRYLPALPSQSRNGDQQSTVTEPSRAALKKRLSTVSRKAVPPPAPSSGETKIQQPPPADQSSLHTSGSRGFRSVVHQAFETDTPNSSSAPSPLGNSESTKRSDSSSTLISPILPSGAFTTTSSIPSTLTATGIISEEPENLSADEIAPAQRLSPLPEFKPGHRRKLTPDVTQPGAERRTVILNNPVRLSSILAEYANTDSEERENEKEIIGDPDSAQSSNDDFVTPESGTPARAQRGDEEELKVKEQESSENTNAENQPVTGGPTPVALKRVSTLDQTVLDIQRLIEPQQISADKDQEGDANNGNSDDNDAQESITDPSTATASSIITSNPALTSPPPLIAPSTAAHTVPTAISQPAASTERPPPLRITTSISDSSNMIPAATMLSPTPTTAATSGVDSALSPHAMSLAAQHNAELENQIMRTLTPNEMATSMSGRSISNASSMSSMMINTVDSSPNWRIAGVAADDSTDASAHDNNDKEKTLSPVAEMGSPVASASSTGVPTSDPRTQSTILSSARIWGNKPSEGIEGGTAKGSMSSPNTESDSDCSSHRRQQQQPQAPPQHRHQQSLDIKSLASPISGPETKRRSLVLTELPDGLGYVEQTRPQLAHKFSWEVDNSDAPSQHGSQQQQAGSQEQVEPSVSAAEQPLRQSDVPEEAGDGGRKSAISAQFEAQGDDFEASALASLNAVQSGVSKTLILPRSNERQEEVGEGQPPVPTVSLISAASSDKITSVTPLNESQTEAFGTSVASGTEEQQQRQQEEESIPRRSTLLAPLDANTLSRTETAETTESSFPGMTSSYAADEAMDASIKSDFSFLPSKTNSPALNAMPSPTASIHDLRNTVPMSSRPGTMGGEGGGGGGDSGNVGSGVAVAAGEAASTVAKSTRTPSRSPSPTASPRPINPKIQPFRAILALDSHESRLNAFIAARDNEAQIDSGLDHWLRSTLAAFPEHAELEKTNGDLGTPTLRTTGMPQRSISSRTFNKIASHHHVRQISGSGLAHFVHSQQVHSKGKDLLHSAGGAAKGLFSRGRNKFRHASGGVGGGGGGGGGTNEG